MAKTKVFITGLGNYHKVGSGGGSSGEPNAYLKSASVEQNKLTIVNKENEQIIYEPQIPTVISTFVKNATISSTNLNLVCVENGVESTKSFGLSTSTINNLISSYLDQNFFEILKLYLGTGFIIDNNLKKISVNQLPEPPQPNFEGIFSKDTQANRYRLYDPATIYDGSSDIKYCLLDINSSEPSIKTYNDGTIPRNQFHEPLFIIDYQGNFNNKQNFLANCTNFNQPLNFSNCNWQTIGSSFMYNCANFNGNIAFPYSIQYIRKNFMNGCSSFNKPLNNLFGSNLLQIEHNFLMNCESFDQDIGLDKTTCPNLNEIELDNLMYNCKNFAKIFHMTNQNFNIFTVYDNNSSDFLKAFATNDATSAVFISGFHISATDKTKNDFDSWSINVNGTNYYLFQNMTTGTPLKKIVVNGVA